MPDTMADRPWRGPARKIERTPDMSAYKALSLALILTAAVQIGWAFAVGFSYSLWDEARRHRRDASGWAEGIVFTDDGEPLIERRGWSRHAGVEGDRRYLSLSGRRPIAAPRLTETLPTRFHDPALKQLRLRDRVVLAASTSHRVAWYVTLDAQNARGYFEIYDRRTRKRVGYLGLDGMQSTAPVEERQFQIAGSGISHGIVSGAILTHQGLKNAWSQRFQSLSNDGPGASDGGLPFGPHQCVAVSGGRALFIDFERGSVSTLLDRSDVLSVAAVLRPRQRPEPSLAANASTDDTVVDVGFQTSDAIVLLDFADAGSTEIPLPGDIADNSPTLTMLPDGSSIVQVSELWHSRPREIDPGAAGRVVHLWRISSDGTHGSPISATLHVPWHSGPDALQRNAVALGAGSPAVAALMELLVMPALQRWDRPGDHQQLVGEWIRLTWLSLILMGLLGIASAWGVERHRRRVRLERSPCWMTFAFLFGPFGYCGYLLHRRWPVLRPAASPQPTGIEVFA